MKIAVLGYGTVGSGIVEVLITNAQSITKKAGTPLHVKYILDKRDFSDISLKEKFVKDIDVILRDAEVEIVAEAMGGLHPAYDFVKACLEQGKSVVTSNKELVAEYGPELLELAKNKRCNFLFEASVAGGIPIIRPLNSALTADEIHEITGILNGTTNFILTKMKADGRSFDEVLHEAQECGYAEQNPEADVEGYDACRKIAILASLALGTHIDYKEIDTQGITKIKKEDIEYASHMGYSIKLLASCKKENDDVYASVKPMMIANEHPLASVNDVFNAVMVKGNMVGDVMFYGKGAGKLPTASAVVADLIDAARHKQTNIMCFWSREKLELQSNEKEHNYYFIRLKGEPVVTQTFVEEVFHNIQSVPVLFANEYAFITGDETIQSLQTKLMQLKDIELLSQIAIKKG